MLLWIIIALSFVACVAAYHMWQGITWQESLMLLVASTLIFSTHLHYIYKKVTTDHYLVTGYVTSLIHRPPFSYTCNKNRTCHERERWLIEQRATPASRNISIRNTIHNGDGEEFCTGECFGTYPAPYYAKDCCQNPPYFHSIEVMPEKFQRTAIGDVSVAIKSYFNPVQASDDIIYDGQTVPNIPYFQISDVNTGNRLIAPQFTESQSQKLERINQKYSGQNLSLGFIVTADTLYFEKLKRAWHQGKANDLVIVITSPDNKRISNVNVLGWNNYNLKENISSALMGLQTLDLDAALGKIEEAIQISPPYSMINFSNYQYLNIKIPDSYYVRILIFQALYFIYTLTLLRLDPNTKTYKLSLSDVLHMWQKNFEPPQRDWYLHPCTPTGLVFYILVPLIVANILWAV